MEGKGIEDIVELRFSPIAEPVTSFLGAFGPGAGTDLGKPQNAILFPQIRFFTNDAWPVIRGIADDNAFPILLTDKYGAGNLLVLTIPNNFTDLYKLPEPTLNALRSYLMGSFPERIEAPAKVSMFAYDNGTLIVESFRDELTQVTVLTSPSTQHLKNLQTGESLSGTPAGHSIDSASSPKNEANTTFRVILPPHSYAAFQQIR